MNEEQTLREMMDWVKRRIEELPESHSVYYKTMLESLRWELKTVKERERPDIS